MEKVTPAISDPADKFEVFSYQALQKAVAENRTKAKPMQVEQFSGPVIEVDWKIMYQLSQDLNYVHKCWQHATPVVIKDRPAIWSNNLKAFIMVVPRIEPPEIISEEEAARRADHADDA